MRAAADALASRVCSTSTTQRAAPFGVHVTSRWLRPSSHVTRSVRGARAVRIVNFVAPSQRARRRASWNARNTAAAGASSVRLTLIDQPSVR
jgi:hypothetical protein